MATGNVEVMLTGSTADGNTASSGPGGALHCLQCNSLALHDCNMNGNEASGPGGAACCEKCDHISVKGTEANHNRATAGAGLFLSVVPAAAGSANKGRVGVFDSSFRNNTASKGAAVSGSDDQSAEGDEGASGEEAVEGGEGAGGALVVKTDVPFTVSNNKFSSNRAAAGHGGGWGVETDTGVGGGAVLCAERVQHSDTQK